MRVALNGLFLRAPATGTGQYLRELARELRRQAPQDEFLFVAPYPDATAPAPLRVAQTHTSAENLAKLEFEQWTFPRASRAGFDVAHVPHFGSPLFLTCPTIVTIHDLIPVVLPEYRGSLGVRLYTRLAMQSARRARAILADSEASARDIASHLGIPRTKIHAIHLAADARFQPPSHAEIERVRLRYALPYKFVLYLGGFDVRKNVRRAIEAFAAVRRELESTEVAGWKLVIAGKLPQQGSDFFPDPRQAAIELGVGEDTFFPGFIDEDDKPALYAAARVLLYPSRHEGFGLPPLEAMASGTPVIAANNSSLPEVVGQEGLLFDADDGRGWSEALVRLLRDDFFWSEQHARGLTQARKFSWGETARKTLEVYHSVV